MPESRRQTKLQQMAGFRNWTLNFVLRYVYLPRNPPFVVTASTRAAIIRANKAIMQVRQELNADWERARSRKLAEKEPDNAQS